MRKLELIIGITLALAITVVCFSGGVSAQEVTATITGTISDPSGAPIANATVTATDSERGTVWPTKTNESGLYSLPRVPIGTYGLKVEATGFQTAIRPPFTLALNQTARIDFTMKMGLVTEIVEVTSAAPILQTDSTQVGTVVDAATNVSMPLASRNYVQLTMLAPGAAHPNPQTMKSGEDTIDSAGRPYINGNREQANNFQLDGVDNNQVADNTLGYTPSVEAIQEFSLITQNANAQFGHYQGGIVSTSIKSGTNSFHGSVFEFMRNDILNANSWQNGLGAVNNGIWAPLPKDKLRWNQFGAAIGGPIIKNKLFFFADYQGQRFDHPSSVDSNTVFTAAERIGDFSALCAAGFNASGVCNDLSQQIYNPFTGGTPFSNNQIPLDLIDPVAAKLFASQYYQPTNDSLTNNLISTTNSNLMNDQGDLKIDYNISSNDRLFFRWSQMHQRYPQNYSFRLKMPSSEQAPVRNSVINWTHTFSSNVINEARVGFNYVNLVTGQGDNGVGNLAQDLGIADGNAHGPGLLWLSFAGTVTDLGNADVEQRFADTVIQYEDNLIITHGRHLIHTGFELQRLRVNSMYSGNSGVWGEMDFKGAKTSGVDAEGNTVGGADVADFFLGLPSKLMRGGASVEWGQRAYLFAGYAQDDWRVTDTLTLNLGLRYENQTPWVEIHDQQVNFGLFSGIPQLPSSAQLTSFNAPGLAPVVGGNRALYDSYNLGYDFQPRIGFAWSPRFLGGKGVIRGAYSVSSFAEGTGSNLRLPRNVPFSPAEIINQNPTTRTEDGIVGGSAADPFAGTTLRVWAPNFQPAASQQWNLSVQHEITNTTALTLAYVGQHGTHLATPLWLKQELLTPSGPVPGPFLAGNPDLKNDVGAIPGTFANGGQGYNALQATLTKRMGNGLQGQIAYTYSKCLTNSAGYYGAGWNGSMTSIGLPYWQNVYDGQSEWGPCYFDETHSLTSYFLYQLPFGRNRSFGKNLNPIANGIVGNWEVGGILSLHTGNAMTVSSWDDPSGTGAWATRLQCVGPITYPKTHITDPNDPRGFGIQWFDPSAFAAPAPGTFGNCSNGNVRGPGLHTFDMSLQKGFPIGESRKVEFWAEFINLTNTPILMAPQYWYGGSNLGMIGPGVNGGSASQGERNIELGLRFTF